MATTHTVVKGDTLWKIAEKYLGSGSKYKQLAAINNISHPDKLYIGQVIKLSKDSSGSGSSTSSKSKTNNNKPKITAFGLQSDADNTLFATWDWGKSNTESYKVVWCYATGVGVAFVGSDQTITVDSKLPSAARQSTYSIPANATRVSFKVLPISKKKKVDKKETTYWTAQWSTTKYFDTDDLPPVAPSSAPAIEIEDYTLTVSYENIVADDLRATGVQFQIIRDNSSSPYKTVKVTIDKTLNMASYTKTVGAGHEYKVRARTYRGNKYSEWTDYSSAATTIPSTPKQITKIRANSETSVYLEWSKVASAKTYDIEYATNKKYFDISDATTTVTGIETTKYEKTGLESGEKYFFRVRAVNESGESGWSGIKSVVIGTKPAAPTTWSSSNIVMTGKNLILYWVHNSEDGSNETKSQIVLEIDGKEQDPIETENPNVNKDEDEQKTRSYTVKTSTYKEGCIIKWKIRTAGITGTYGPWSIQRKVNVYAPPTLDLLVTDSNANALGTIEKFPFYIRGVAGPDSQNPIGYHVSITADGSYISTDNVGNDVYINAGQEIYSKYFNTTEDLVIKMSANNINLENNMSYTVKCTVTMDSGLTHEEVTYFNVEWEDQEYEPNADIGVDPETLEAIISPHCRTYTYTNYLVTYDSDSDEYTRTDTTLGNVYGDIMSGIETTTGDDVYSGMNEDGEDIFYTIVEKITRVTGVKLSVYRREFDGTFTEIGTGIKNNKGTYVTDPHPSLDYARYRVVVTVTETGAISYYDVPGYPVNEPSVVIQWDEKWSNFETDTEDELEQPPWAGSMIKIPYNIDISDKHQSDVSLVEYIGRSHPVSYYGTQVGQTSSWSMEIPKDDKETLYALRRLAIWMGDVYVREPSGSGYWANISVSFNQSHCEVTIPVSLEVTRVEGGM